MLTCNVCKKECSINNMILQEKLMCRNCSYINLADKIDKIVYSLQTLSAEFKREGNMMYNRKLTEWM